MNRILVILAVVTCWPLSAAAGRHARDWRTDFINDARKEVEEFYREAMTERDAFRDSAFARLNRWIDAPWEPRPMEEAVPVPHKDDRPVTPVILGQGEQEPPAEDVPVRDNAPVVRVDSVRPDTKPLIPRGDAEPAVDRFAFRSYGTAYEADASPGLRFTLGVSRGTDAQQAVRETLDGLDRDAFLRLVASLSAEAEEHALSQWAYFRLVGDFAQAFMPGRVNEQRVLEGLLMIYEGYDVRFAQDDSGRIYRLLGCVELLPEHPYVVLDGKRFYAFEDSPATLRIATGSMPGTECVSAKPSGRERFDMRRGEPHHVVLCDHSPHCCDNRCHKPLAEFDLTGNLNRMDFYAGCPMTVDGCDPDTKWNSYAGGLLSDEIRAQFYPALRKLIEGRTRLEAVNLLMKFVEAFDYGSDNEIWGGDRAFFAEETLHYPLRDCEDGAILLTRLVRDLVGLPVALVYYPGHLAAAVAFDTYVSGAYLSDGGRRYTVCDPTYYYVDAGVQMPASKVDAGAAVLIPVRND